MGHTLTRFVLRLVQVCDMIVVIAALASQVDDPG
jgi:hypothetical protein